LAGAIRVFEHRALQYRRNARGTLFGSFANPVLFLGAMGLGLGGYVDRTGADVLGGTSYLAFLAPGLLAATVMQSAAFESSYRIMDGLRWNRVFQAMAATPIDASGVALGNLLWIAARLTMIAVAFTIVMILFGGASSPLVVLAIPAAVLTGMAFSAPIIAYAATQRTPDAFNAIYRFGVVPLFLLSGTFFPLDGLPAPIQAAAWLSPLWHGSSLTRALAGGSIGDDPLGAAVHLGVLLVVATLGVLAAMRTFERDLGT